jgi:hypothetical protein
LLLNLLFLDAVGLQLQRPGRRSLAYLWLTALAAVAWQYASLFVVGGGLLGGAVAAERGSRRDWLRVMAGVLSLAVLQLVAVQYPQIRSQGIVSDFLNEWFYSWNKPLVALSFLATKLVEMLDYLTQTSPAGIGLRLVSLAAWLPLVLGIIVARRAGGRGRALLVTTVLPVVALMVLAGLRLHPFGGIRHCLPLAPGILLLYATGLEVLRRSVPMLSALSLMILVAVSIRGNWTSIPGWHVYDTMDLVARVETLAQPGDVACFSTLSGSVRRFYARGTRNRFAEIVYCDGGTDPAGPDEVRPRRRPSPRVIESQLVAALRRSPRLWLISADDNMAGIEKLLAPHAHKSADLRGRLSRASLWKSNTDRELETASRERPVPR